MLAKSERVLILNFFMSLKLISSTVWLRNPNERGPTAVNAGTKCLGIMSKYYFVNPRITRTENIGYFHSVNLSAPSTYIELNFLVHIHAQIANSTNNGLQIRVLSDGSKIDSLVNVDPRSVMLTDYFLIVTDDFLKFQSLMSNIITKSSAWNPGAKFLLLFNNPYLRQDGCSATEIVSKFFDILYNKFDVFRVVILYATGITTYDVYVTNPYKDEKDCKTLKPILIDKCDNGQLKNDEFTKISVRASKVPEKVPACTFTFCAKENVPYMKEGCTSGLEIDIMQILQDIMKFKTKTICSNLGRGEPFGNGSWTGLLGLLRDDKCNFVIGGFYPDNEVHEDFGVTHSYFEDSYTWFVYLAPFREPWKGLIEILNSETWLLLIIILLTAGLSWYVFGKVMHEENAHRKFVLCVMNSLAVFLGISSNNRPNYNTLRVFFVFLALYGLNITTIYTSKLITVFTSPAYDKQISTIQEIMDMGLPIGGREEHHDWFSSDNPLDQIIYKKYNTTNRFLPTVENMKLVRDGYISILSNRINVLSRDLGDQIFGIPGNVFSNPIEMIAERGFPLIRKFNTLISRMKDAGLMSKIYNDFLFDMLILERIRNRESISDIGQIVLTLQHLQGAFAVLIVGFIISFNVFIIEITSKSQWFRQFLRKVSEFLIYLWNILPFRYKNKKKPLKLKKKLT